MGRKIQTQLWAHSVTYRLKRIFARRDYKDRLFVRLFHDKKELLRLYNALNGTTYEDPDELTVTTIEDVVYLGMKNDCSFIIGSYLNLYEQQSTFNPNMPIRGLIYLVHIYEAHISVHGLNLYGSRQIPLPAPKYVVFYNGTGERPDREELKLSDAFEGADSCLEFTAVVYNVNQGHNQELMKQCQTLEGYSILIGKVREYQAKGSGLAEAVDEACRYCIEHDILRDFLIKHRNEVNHVILTEYNPKKQREMDRRDAREEGLSEGRSQGLLEGRSQGLLEGRSQGLLEGGIRTMVQDNAEEQIPRARTVEKLQRRFLLTKEEAERYYDMYSTEEN